MRLVAALALVMPVTLQEDPKVFKGLEVELFVEAQVMTTVDVLPCRIEIRNTSKVPFVTHASLALNAAGVSFLIRKGEIGAPALGKPLPGRHPVNPCVGCCVPSKLPGPQWSHYSKERPKFSMEPGTSIRLVRVLSLMMAPAEWKDAGGLPLPGTWWIQASLSVIDGGDYYSNAVKITVETPEKLPKETVKIFSSPEVHTRSVRCLWGKESPRSACLEFADLKPFVDYLGSGVKAPQNPLLSLAMGHAFRTGRRLQSDEEIKDPKTKKKVKKPAGTVVGDPETALAYFQTAADGLKKSCLHPEAVFMIAKCQMELGRRAEAIRTLGTCSPDDGDHRVKLGILSLKRELGMN